MVGPSRDARAGIGEGGTSRPAGATGPGPADLDSPRAQPPPSRGPGVRVGHQPPVAARRLRRPVVRRPVVAVGADRDGIEGLARAERAGVPTFIHRVKDFASREEWDAALTAAVTSYQPDLVVSAGFMKLVGETFLARGADGSSTPTPPCRRRSPGCTAPPTRWRTA